MTKRKLSDQRREAIYAELSALLGAGVDFSNAFAMMIDAEENGAAKTLLQELYARVAEGSTLQHAMRQCGLFPPIDCGVVDIGEQTGRLNEALEFLTEYYRKTAERRRMISDALTYPIVVMCTAAAVTAFMLAVVVPMFEQVYARMGGELPAMTKGIIGIADRLPACAATAAALIAAAAAAYGRNRNDENVRRITGAVMLKIPVAGKIIRLNNQARICKMIDLTCEAGIPLLAGLEMTARAVEFHQYRASLEKMARMIEQGTQLSDALATFPELYDRKLTALVRIGEQTNRIRMMIGRQGEAISRELEQTIKRCGAIAEPALILLVGILVATILIAMYLPMFRLGGIMG